MLQDGLGWARVEVVASSAVVRSKLDLRIASIANWADCTSSVALRSSRQGRL